MTTQAYTTQTAYEAICEYFSRRGAQLAKVEEKGSPTCKYRAGQEDGTVLKCAVGCLIPDDLYNSNWEGHGAGFVYSRLAGENNSLFAAVDKQFLAEAQRLHDIYAQNALQFVDLLDLLAVKYNLNVNPDSVWA